MRWKIAAAKSAGPKPVARKRTSMVRFGATHVPMP